MKILEAMSELLDQLAAFEELDVDAVDLPATPVSLSDESVVAAMADFAAIANHASRAQAVLAGVAAHRSRRENGHSGLGGDARTRVARRADPGDHRRHQGRRAAPAARRNLAARGLGSRRELCRTPVASTRRSRWHEPLRRALLDARLTSAQHDAIRRGSATARSGVRE